jgi:glycine dehydrogenase
MTGMKVVPVKVRQNGNLDLDDLKAKAEKHRDELAAFMVCLLVALPLFSYPMTHNDCYLKVTYPSTYGVFENTITEACKIIHENGGQVYLDGEDIVLVSILRPS